MKCSPEFIERAVYGECGVPYYRMIDSTEEMVRCRWGWTWKWHRKYHNHNPHDPQHDKTNKVNVPPAKTQISLGIRPVRSESSLSAWRKLGSLATHWVHSEDSWSDWADAQADLSLRWVYSHFVGFVMSRLMSYQWRKEEE